MGAVLAGAMIPLAAFAEESGPERPLNSTKLPFLREASSGQTVTIHYGDAGQTSNNGSEGEDGNTGPVEVAPGGLLSQGNDCPFRDISGHSSENAINYLYNNGVAGGRRPCYFDPNAAATRAEVTAMVVRAVEAPLPEPPVEKAFPDTDLKAWSPRHVKAAKDADIVHGYPDGLFRAEKPVNLVETLKITTRGFEVADVQPDPTQLSGIEDIELDQWYVRYVQAGINEGLIDSSAHHIAPASEVTRAEAAEMIYILMTRREDG
jgi:hypothetical protein